MNARCKFPVFVSIGLVLLVMGWQDVAAYNGKFPGKGSRAEWNRAAKLYNQARVLKENKRADEAIALYTRAIAIYPYDPAFFNNLAITYEFDKNQLPEAEKAILRAIALAPRDFDFHWEHAVILWRQGRGRESKVALDRAKKCSMDSKQVKLLQKTLKAMNSRL